MSAALDRLGRRGILTIVAEDGSYDVRLKAPGPYGKNGSCTTDKADLYEYVHLGASSWQGEGSDLDALLLLCEIETRPRTREIDDLRWDIEYRRNSRTHGPPLPSYRKWHGWSPGDERWLRTSAHKYEYLDGYLRRDLVAEKTFLAEQAERDRRVEIERVRRVLA